MARKPRKHKVQQPAAPEGIPAVPTFKAPLTARKPRKSEAPDLLGKIVFITPAELETAPEKAPKKRRTKKEVPAPERQDTPADIIEEKKAPAKSVRKNESKVITPDRAPIRVATLAPKDKVAKPARRSQAVTPVVESEVTPSEEPKATPKKKQTQASWDKWVKQTVVAVSPDVWGIHASELSHSGQLLADPKRVPRQILLDTPTLDYLFRCPDRLSHGARLMLNEEGVECLVSMESIREWTDKMRTGHYISEKPNGFFDKILDRFDLKSVSMDTEAYQKYASLQSASHIDISWEHKPDDWVSTRLDVDARPTRLIAAQALVLGIPIVSPDLRFGAYKKEGLKTIW